MSAQRMTAFANLSLRVEPRGETWRVQVLDLGERETYYEIVCADQLAAKAAAVDFALARLFGPRHGKDTKRIAETLTWAQHGAHECRPF